MTPFIASLLNHLWQSSAVAALAWLVCRYALRTNGAGVRFDIWLAASIKFLVPFSLLIDLGYRIGARPVVTLTETRFVWTIATEANAAVAPFVGLRTVRTSIDWTTICIALWAIGAARVLHSWFSEWRQFRRAAASAEPFTTFDGIPVMKSRHLKDWKVEPGVFGLLRQVILLPDGIESHLSPDQLRGVLAHEAAHARRHDNLTAALQMLLEAIFWFFPIVRWLGLRQIEEREAACDAAALRQSHPKAYAEGILNVCNYYAGSPLPCVAGTTGADLKARVRAIWHHREPEPLNTVQRWGMAAALGLAIIAPAILGIATAPLVLAQTDNFGASNVKFEVATIRPGDPNGFIEARTPSLTLDSTGSLHFVRTGLREMIQLAYGVGATQISGPAFLNGRREAPADRWDVIAKVPDGAKPEQLPLMLRALLADRFHLVFHTENRNVQVFAMEVAKGGIKMKESPEGPGDAACTRSFAGNERTERLAADCTRMSSKDIAQQMQTLAPGYFNQAPLMDFSGLKGRYDFHIEWVTGAAYQAGDSPSMPDAMEQQLGLKLDNRRQSVEILVIDKLDRTPTEN